MWVHFKYRISGISMCCAPWEWHPAPDKVDYTTLTSGQFLLLFNNPAKKGLLEQVQNKAAHLSLFRIGGQAKLNKTHHCVFRWNPTLPCEIQPGDTTCCCRNIHTWVLQFYHCLWTTTLNLNQTGKFSYLFGRLFVSWAERCSSFKTKVF